MAKKKTYTSEFKAKVVRELIEGDDSVGVVASKYQLNATMLSGWRKHALDNMDLLFSQDKQVSEQHKLEEKHNEEVDNLNRIIGKLTVERDYLQQRVIEKFN